MGLTNNRIALNVADSLVVRIPKPGPGSRAEDDERRDPVVVPVYLT
jgi:hypothetical protein